MTYLETLKHQVLRLELIEPEGVDDEDGVVDDVAERRADDEEPPAVEV